MKGKHQGGHSSHSCIWAREPFSELAAILSSWEGEWKRKKERGQRARRGSGRRDLHPLVSKNTFFFSQNSRWLHVTSSRWAWKKCGWPRLNLSERKVFGKRSLDWNGKKSTFRFHIWNSWEGNVPGWGEKWRVTHISWPILWGVGGGARAGKWEKSNGRQLLSAALRCTEATLHSWEKAFCSVYLHQLASQFMLPPRKNQRWQ